MVGALKSTKQGEEYADFARVRHLLRDGCVDGHGWPGLGLDIGVEGTLDVQRGFLKAAKRAVDPNHASEQLTLEYLHGLNQDLFEMMKDHIVHPEEKTCAGPNLLGFESIHPEFCSQVIEIFRNVLLGDVDFDDDSDDDEKEVQLDGEEGGAAPQCAQAQQVQVEVQLNSSPPAPSSGGKGGGRRGSTKISALAGKLNFGGPDGISPFDRDPPSGGVSPFGQRAQKNINVVNNSVIHFDGKSVSLAKTTSRLIMIVNTLRHSSSSRSSLRNSSSMDDWNQTLSGVWSRETRLAAVTFEEKQEQEQELLGPGGHKKGHQQEEQEEEQKEHQQEEQEEATPVSKPKQTTFDLKILQMKPYPVNIDVASREMYLTDADFEALFQMKKESWLKLPTWKRVAAKKIHNLF